MLVSIYGPLIMALTWVIFVSKVHHGLSGEPYMGFCFKYGLRKQPMIYVKH